MSADILVGCCGFPEAKRAYYAEFPIVELQSTFYQPPSLGLAARWRSEAPAAFLFTMKAWQVITHPATSPTYRRMRRRPASDDPRGYGLFQPSEEVRRAWRVSHAIAATLRAPVILFQCPPSFRQEDANIEHLRSFLREARRDVGESTALVWEPRGKWDAAMVRDLCEELGLSHGVDPLASEPAAGAIAYFRLHGGTRYRHCYSERELERLLDICRAQLAAGRRPVYVLFNNVAMLDDARRFQRLVAG